MKYKGYEAVVTFDEDAKIFHGEIINIKDVITFQSLASDKIQSEFEASVDDYLAYCEKRGELPNKV